MWQVAWAHPMYGNLLASCSYDRKVIIWKEENGTWDKMYEYTGHDSSGNITHALTLATTGLWDQDPENVLMKRLPRMHKCNCNVNCRCVLFSCSEFGLLGTV